MREALRWIARIAGLVAIVLAVAMVISQGWINTSSPGAREYLLGLCLLFCIAGIIVAWRRERLGSAITFLGLGALYVAQLRYPEAFPSALYLMFIVPGGLFRFSGWFGRRR